MAIVSMNNLLEAGVHFGHQTKRWNPKMKEYIFTAREDIYIIDLEKTVACMERAYEELKKISENGGKFIFVGTKKQASEVAKEEAIRSESFYVTERWLGGTLTNFRTIRKRIKRLDEIEKMEADGTFDLLPKKEVIGIKKEYEKLNRVLSGIRAMEKLPDAMIIIDPKKEINAIREARRLNIPVFGIVDTNCDPDDVDYVIPGNDDAVRSVKIMLGVLNNAICEGKGLPLDDYITEEEHTQEDTKAEKMELEAKKAEDDEVVPEKKKAPKKEVKKEVEEKEVKEEKPAKKATAKKEEAPKKAAKKTEDLSKKTVAELKDMAREAGITGISTMKKDDLIKALSK